MKKALILVFVIISGSTTAQRYVNPAGIDNFTGTWQYFNGTDTIQFKCVTRYIGNENIQVKALFVHYTYKQGNIVLWNNFSNSPNIDNADLGGSRIAGANNDTAVVGGTDILKRKTEEGYLILNGDKTQLKYVRDIGVGGGGVRYHESGQGPLAGYTLPAEFTMTKLIFTEMRPGQGKSH